MFPCRRAEGKRASHDRPRVKAETQAMDGAATHPFRWAMLAGVWLIYLCFGLTIAAMAPLVGTVTQELGISNSAMGSVLGAWPLVYIFSAIPCGALLDRIGPRWGLLLAALIMAASGGLRGFADGHLSLFLATALFGLGGPLISVGAPKVIALWFEGKERGLAMGIYITGPSLGAIAAFSLTNSVAMPAFGGDWRLVLFVYAAVVLISAVVWLAIGAHPAARAVERDLAAEPRRSQFAVFAELIGLRSVQIMLVMAVGIFFFNHSISNWLPEILRSGGMDARSAGYWASVSVAAAILGSLLIPRLAVPSRRLLIMFLLVLSAGIATLLIPQPPGPLLASGLILQGITRGSMMTIAILILVERPEVGARHAGAAGGLFFSAAEVGGVLGPLTVGYLADVTGDFGAALHLLTGICAALMLLLALLRRQHG